MILFVLLQIENFHRHLFTHIQHEIFGTNAESASEHYITSTAFKSLFCLSESIKWYGKQEVKQSGNESACGFVCVFVCASKNHSKWRIMTAEEIKTKSSFNVRYKNKRNSNVQCGVKTHTCKRTLCLVDSYVGFSSW